MQTPQKRSFALFYLLGTIAIVVAAVFVYWFWQGKQKATADEAAARATLAQAGPTLPVAKAVRGPNVRRLTLVGEALPFETATLYSKVSGYLTRIAVDVGDQVKAGQFIAEVRSPELDHQVHSAQVSLENKRRVLERTRSLAEQGFFSKQALDNAETDVKVAESQLAELRTVSGYRVLKAPFTGVVTQRFADPGALVTNASSNQSSALPVVTIVDGKKLKVTVYVDQVEAPNVKPGLPVEIIDASDPARRTQSKVTRVSGELDPRTRTLTTEVDFDNSAGQFMAGSFVNVTLLIPATSYIEVPAAALVARDKKNLVAIVGSDNHVQFRPIETAGTDGKVLRVASGLAEGEQVALNVPATLTDGGRITPAPPPPGTSAAAPPSAAPLAAPSAPAVPATGAGGSPKK